jgi:hypothetical protein
MRTDESRRSLYVLDNAPKPHHLIWMPKPLEVAAEHSRDRQANQGAVFRWSGAVILQPFSTENTADSIT